MIIERLLEKRAAIDQNLLKYLAIYGAPTIAGAGIGALADKKNPWRGAFIGGALGAGTGGLVHAGYKYFNPEVKGAEKHSLTDQGNASTLQTLRSLAKDNGYGDNVNGFMDDLEFAHRMTTVPAPLTASQMDSISGYFYNNSELLKKIKDLQEFSRTYGGHGVIPRQTSGF